MASMNVSVPDPMREWVQQRIDSGQYENVSDYVLELIRRDEAQPNWRAEIVAALIDGEQSGLSCQQVPEIVAAVIARRRLGAGEPPLSGS